MVYLHRFQRCILPHTNSQSVQEVHTFSRPGLALSTTHWPVHSSHGVHSSGQRGQTDGFTEGYKDPPVPRRLVGQSQIPPNPPLPRTRLADEQGEIRTGSKTGFQLHSLPFRPERGQGQTHTRALAGLNIQDSNNVVRFSVPSPAVHVSYRSSQQRTNKSTWVCSI